MKNLRYLSFVASLCLVVVLGYVNYSILPVIAQAQPANPTPPTELGAEKGSIAAGVIIRTDDPDQLIRLASKQGIAVTSTTPLPDNESFVVLDSDIGSSNTQLLQFQARNIITTKPTTNYTYTAAITPNDPQYVGQDNLRKIQAEAAWDITTGSTDTVIAIIDSGVLFSQSWSGSPDCPPSSPCEQIDLVAAKRWVNPSETINGVDSDNNGFIDDRFGWDFIGGFTNGINCPNYLPGSGPNAYEDSDNDPQPYSCDSPNAPTILNKNHYNGTCEPFVSACLVGHGTSVASVAAASTNNALLTTGVDWNAKIMNIRGLDGYGVGSSASITASIEYAVASGADVINLSLAVFNQNGSCAVIDAAMEAALLRANQAGVVVVAAAGNTGGGEVCYPARSVNAIAVGASTQDDQRASFSSYGAGLDVVAPGVGVPSVTAPSKSNSNSTYVTRSGTSFSAPHVAGLAGLLKSLSPNANLTGVRATIMASADKTAGMRGNLRTDQFGFGRVNLYQATKHASTLHPDGSLVRLSGTPHIYLLEDGKRRRVATPAVLTNQRFNTNLRPATLADIDLPTAADVEFREGTLLKADGSSKIYIVNYRNAVVEKRHITNPGVFTELGLSSKSVLRIPARELPGPTGASVSSTAEHPDGLLVRASGGTRVYLLENSQKRLVAHPPALSSYRFASGIKTATSTDLARPNGPLLNYREGTVLRGDNPPIYVVDYDVSGINRRHIRTLPIFRLLNFAGNEIDRVSDRHLPNKEGEPIQ